jgi:hypothetical protein
MTDINVQPDEMTLLRERAKLMGITHSPNIGLDTLRERVNGVLKGQGVDEEKSIAAPGVESKAQRETHLRREASEMVRIMVVPMNSAKKDWDGEIFDVANGLCQHKKFVPFNNEAGWHVPKMMYNMIRDRKYQLFYKKKLANGEYIRAGKLVKEFSVEILPKLTPVEIQELKIHQARADNLGSS